MATNLTLFMLLVLSFTFTYPLLTVCENAELSALMAIKASLDPKSKHLFSWSEMGDFCTDFEGVACDEYGHVMNISLQGKGLSGKIPAEIGQLKNLTGLYLHFNALVGDIPMEISNLTHLSDLYLNVNHLQGQIPTQIGNMSNLQVLQLCYNKLSGSIPTQLGSLKRLTVLALQYNNLAGAIPASLGELGILTRLDVSFNTLFGSIPLKLATAPMLEVLDVRNNTLSGRVPSELQRLKDGFHYENNLGLCGVEFTLLKGCNSDYLDANRREPFGPNNNRSTKDIPESANLKTNCSEATHCSSPSKKSHVALILGVIGVIILLMVMGLLIFSWNRRQKQKIGNAFDSSDARLSTDQVREVRRKSASPLISLEYAKGWDPLAKSRNETGFSQEVLESFMFNLEDVESATQYFSEMNLLGKSNFSAVYKGVLRNGLAVAVKCVAKSSCKSDEAEFLKGLKMLTSLKQENIVKLRGFCCSKGRGECFLIYDFVENGNLLQYLDLKYGNPKVLDWSTRISIIHGIAKGIRYLHGKEGNKHALVHQNISAEKVLIDKKYNPLIADPGLHKLLVDDIVFSTLKASAAMGYLAPEYTTTGRFTEKSDVYAFGMIIFQVICGKRRITQSISHGAELCTFEEFVDPNLEGKYSESEATKLGEIALLCTDEAPSQRPTIENVMQELSDLMTTCS